MQWGVKCVIDNASAFMLQVVDSENLVSLFVIVSKHSVKEWEGCYETLSSYVVSAGFQHRGTTTPKRIMQDLEKHVLNIHTCLKYVQELASIMV